jgi:hypothetical protein
MTSLYIYLHQFFFSVYFAALVPLEEFREINFSKQYGLTNDPEVLDILDTVSKTKGVYTNSKEYMNALLCMVN